MADDEALRGKSTNRIVVSNFEIIAENTILCSGGIGGNFDLVKKYWPSKRIGKFPEFLISGVPDYVDGKIQQRASEQGVSLINIMDFISLATAAHETSRHVFRLLIEDTTSTTNNEDDDFANLENAQ